MLRGSSIYVHCYARTRFLPFLLSRHEFQTTWTSHHQLHKELLLCSCPAAVFRARGRYTCINANCVGCPLYVDLFPLGTLSTKRPSSEGIAIRPKPNILNKHATSHHDTQEDAPSPYVSVYPGQSQRTCVRFVFCQRPRLESP